MDTLILKNYQLKTFVEALDYSMPFAKGRVKNRFVSILIPKMQAMEKNRLEILNELCEKDKDGKPITENGQYKLTEKNQTKWNEEYNKMMMEECIIDVTPSVKSDLGTIKDIINNSTVDLKTEQITILEEIIKSLEVTKPKKLPEAKKK